MPEPEVNQCTINISVCVFQWEYGTVGLWVQAMRLGSKVQARNTHGHTTLDNICLYPTTYKYPIVYRSVYGPFLIYD